MRKKNLSVYPYFKNKFKYLQIVISKLIISKLLTYEEKLKEKEYMQLRVILKIPTKLVDKKTNNTNFVY